jgi:hypothetical protein
MQVTVANAALYWPAEFFSQGVLSTMRYSLPSVMQLSRSILFEAASGGEGRL